MTDTPPPGVKEALGALGADLAALARVRLELVAIELGYTIDQRCDGRGNCEVERATFRYKDGAGKGRSGSVIDVHLGRR